MTPHAPHPMSRPGGSRALVRRTACAAGKNAVWRRDKRTTPPPAQRMQGVDRTEVARPTRVFATSHPTQSA
jgi:hypothetical protein